MEIDPVFLTAIVAAIGAAYSTWRTARKDERTNKVTATVEGVKVTAEFDLKRDQMLTEAMQSHFDRLEKQVGDAAGRIDALSTRVGQLEQERETMLAWMAHNRLTWPPPEEFGG